MLLSLGYPCYGPLAHNAGSEPSLEVKACKIHLGVYSGVSCVNLRTVVTAVI